MLRRHFSKLVDELEKEIAISSSSNKKKRKREETTTTIKAESSGSEVEVHGRWLRDILVPKCYFAFSQLLADNQFATLGLCCMGVLASVRCAITKLLGEVQTDEEQETSARKEPAASSISASVEVLDDKMDLGEVISRDTRDQGSACGARAQAERQRFAIDGIATGNKADATKVMVEEPGKTAKKKKKKRKGDEFDDLFKNLV